MALFDVHVSLYEYTVIVHADPKDPESKPKLAYTPQLALAGNEQEVLFRAHRDLSVTDAEDPTRLEVVIRPFRGAE